MQSQQMDDSQQQKEKMTDEIFTLNNDTICAISTPHGTGGIAIVRISGNNAIDIVDTIWKGKKLADVKSHTAHLGTLTDNHGNPIDQALATIFRAPNSFTGEDVVELGIHGSRWLQKEILNILINAGARIAEHGEFSQRAFKAGKLDLSQVEAVADLIASTSRASHRAAINQLRGSVSERIETMRQDLLKLAALIELELDFSEEDVEFASRKELIETAQTVENNISDLLQSFTAGNAIKNGVPIAIIGPTNAGKSSLLNALLGDDKAIVSDIHGTTRDVIEDTLEIGDYLVRFKDTAGLRETDNQIEQLGIKKTTKEAQNADIVLYVIDPTNPVSATQKAKDIQNIEKHRIIEILNKTDLTDTIPPVSQNAIRISAKTGEGIENLRKEITSKIETLDGNPTGQTIITSVRQALRNALTSIKATRQALSQNVSGDFVAQDLRETIHHLSTITGHITTPEILQTLFSAFCIGK